MTGIVAGDDEWYHGECRRSRRHQDRRRAALAHRAERGGTESLALLLLEMLEVTINRMPLRAATPSTVRKPTMAPSEMMPSPA